MGSQTTSQDAFPQVVPHEGKARKGARLASASKRLAQDGNRHDVRQSQPGSMVITLAGAIMGTAARRDLPCIFGHESSGEEEENELCWRLRNGKCGMTIPDLS